MKKQMTDREFVKETQRLLGNFCDHGTVILSLKRILEFQENSRRAKVVTFKHWDGSQFNWFPEIEGFYFIVIDKYPKANGDLRHLQLHSGSVSIAYQSVREAENAFAALLAKYDDFDWRGCNPRIVKAACAFDAHTEGGFILQKQLTVEIKTSVA